MQFYTGGSGADDGTSTIDFFGGGGSGSFASGMVNMGPDNDDAPGDGELSLGSASNSGIRMYGRFDDGGGSRSHLALDGESGEGVYLWGTGSISAFDGTGNSVDIDGVGNINLSNPNATFTLWNNGDGVFMERIFDGVNPQGGRINVAGDGFIDIDGTSGNIDISGAYLNTSDRRLKMNISPLNNTLDSVLKLRGVSYNWKDKKVTTKNQIGVIAQEVEEVYPEFVHTKKDGFKSVNYAQMAAVLIEAVKELNAKITALETENTTLKTELSKVASLEDRLKQIEKLLTPRKQNNAANSNTAIK